MDWEKVFKYSIIAMITAAFIELGSCWCDSVILDVWYVLRSYFAETMFILLTWTLFPDKPVIRFWSIPLALYWLYNLTVDVTLMIDEELYNKINTGIGYYVILGIGAISATIITWKDGLKDG